MHNILFIIGSLRKNSFNRQLATVISSELAGKATFSTLQFDDIPYMNQDIEWPTPEAIHRVRQDVAAADGVWIVTPEYNSNFPGLLKNLLDWLSRPTVQGSYKSAAMYGKKVTVSGAGGRNATAGSRARLTELLKVMRADVMPGEGVGIAVNPDAFKTDKVVFTDEQRRLLHNQAEAFLAFLQ
ncbi:MAG: NADPH-dependent FMN reductase [Pyramidobacter sp.]|jgi:chromate reductase